MKTTWHFFLPAGTTRRQASLTSTCRSPAATRAFPRPVVRTGTLSFLFPHVDAETRTLTVRFELPNADHELRPGMTATVTLKLDHELLAENPGRGCGSRTAATRGDPSPLPGRERDRRTGAEEGRLPRDASRTRSTGWRSNSGRSSHAARRGHFLPGPVRGSRRAIASSPPGRS